MKTKEINVERNYRVDNSDPYMKARFNQTVIPEEGETTEEAADMAIKQLDNIFRLAYPHVEEHINFYVARQVHKPFSFKVTSEAPNGIQKEIEKERNPTQLELIQSCTNIKVLSIYDKIPLTKEERAAYNQRVKEISNLKK